MKFDTDTNFKALEGAVYCPPFKDENAIETLELDEFNVEKVKTLIRDSIPLLSYSKKFRPLILEILDILEENRNDFLVDQQRYISFYWNGILIVRIIIDKDVGHDKQLHVSIQKYVTEKEEIVKDKKWTRITGAGIVGVLTLGVIITGMAFFKTKS